MFSVLLVCSIFSFSQTFTEHFLVKGNCGQCKARIEKAALKAGATSANWTAENQTLTMTLDESKVKCDDILKQIAEVGHDNEKFKAPDEVYKNLPACCLYTRDSDFTAPNENIHSDENEIAVVKLTKEKEATAISKKKPD